MRITSLPKLALKALPLTRIHSDMGATQLSDRKREEPHLPDHLRTRCVKRQDQARHPTHLPRLPGLQRNEERHLRREAGVLRRHRPRRFQDQPHAARRRAGAGEEGPERAILAAAVEGQGEGALPQDEL